MSAETNGNDADPPYVERLQGAINMQFLSAAFFVEYFKDMVLGVLFLIAFAIWFRSRRIEIRDSRVHSLND